MFSSSVEGFPAQESKTQEQKIYLAAPPLAVSSRAVGQCGASLILEYDHHRFAFFSICDDARCLVQRLALNPHEPVKQRADTDEAGRSQPEG